MPEINGVTILELPHRHDEERGDFIKVLSLSYLRGIYEKIC